MQDQGAAIAKSLLGGAAKPISTSDGQIRAWKPGSRRNVPAKQIWAAAKPNFLESAGPTVRIPVAFHDLAWPGRHLHGIWLADS